MVLSVWMKRYPLWKLTSTTFSTTVCPKLATTVTYFCPLFVWNSLLAGICTWVCVCGRGDSQESEPLDLLCHSSDGQESGSWGSGSIVLQWLSGDLERRFRGEGLRGRTSEGMDSVGWVSEWQSTEWRNLECRF